jgi:hypothetical protein
MDEQYKEMLEELVKLRRNKTITSVKPLGSASLNSMDFASLYPSTMTYHLGGLKSKRIVKIKKILNRINDNT